MKFGELLDILGDEPMFLSSLLRAGDVDPADIGAQLSRWVAGGRLISLRRGVYALAPRYRRREPHAFEIANMLVRPSYVSLESALSFHGLIPEAVFSTTSVARGRPSEYATPLGRFTYRVVAEDLFWGYASVPVSPDAKRTAFVARPEKALLDLVYLRPGGDSTAFLAELRLDRLESLDLGLLSQFARRSSRPKLMRAADNIARLAREHADEWVSA